MYHMMLRLSKRFCAWGRIWGRNAVYSFKPRVDIRPFVTQKTNQAQVELERQIHRQTRGRTDGGEDWHASGDTFLRNLKADPTRYKHDRILKWQVLKPGKSDEFIDRIVPSDILAHGQQFTWKREQGGSVQSSGGIESGLNFAQ